MWLKTAQVTVYKVRHQTCDVAVRWRFFRKLVDMEKIPMRARSVNVIMNVAHCKTFRTDPSAAAVYPLPFPYFDSHGKSDIPMLSSPSQCCLLWVYIFLLSTQHIVTHVSHRQLDHVGNAAFTDICNASLAASANLGIGVVSGMSFNVRITIPFNLSLSSSFSPDELGVAIAA